ncbi:hypothetical protein BH11PSE11_BH11PSE11_17890 [soil metagenome]
MLNLLSLIRRLLVLALLLGLFSPAHALVPQIAAGYYHNVVLDSDGKVWAWGYNGFGQLGIGATAEATTPVQISGLSSVRAVGAGFFHSVALKNDCTVWAWGDNGFDQLGLGNTVNSGISGSSVPVQVPGLSNVVAIAAAGAHTLALKDNGTVWAWGWNAYGQLGIGSLDNSKVPVQVAGLQAITSIATGYFHSMVLNETGSVWTWGYNGRGQLGNGTLNPAVVPMPVPNLDGVIALAGGGGHTLALRRDGNLWAWGWNNFGQLGNGSTTDSHVPLLVNGSAGTRAIATGFFHSMALGNGGTVKSWGNNAYGQLGVGSKVDTLSPQAVPALAGIAAIAASNNHSLALNNDGRLSAWGWNEDGQLGNASHLDSTVPVTVKGPGSLAELRLGVSSFQDLWNDPAQPGWGIPIAQHDAMLFASWFTYDASGKPVWLVIPGGTWSGSTFSGALYATTGQNTGIAFLPGAVNATVVGRADFNFTDVNHATLSYTYKGEAGQRALSRYVFDTSANTPALNYSDMWWTPAESGWGLIINQQFQTIFASWLTYDAAGLPIWMVMPSGSWTTPSTYAGALYRTRSAPTGTALSQGDVTATQVGSATLTFGDSSNAVLSYSVDGVTGNKTITRMRF